jgi:hypothetical protein
METKQNDLAFLSASLPCNPIPFINRLHELVKDNMDNVTSDQFKANLWILLTQSYGQLFSVDSCDEYSRLKDSLTK